MNEADAGMTPASDSGSEFTGDLGLPTPEDTSDLVNGSSLESDPAESGQTQPEHDDEGLGEGAPREQAAQAAAAYKALGRDWESEAAFEQHYRSMEGRVRAQGQEAAKLNNLVDQWERWHEYQQTQAAVSPAPAQANSATAAQKAAEPFLEAVDWGAVKRINESKGFEAAMQAVVIGLQDHIQKEVVGGIQQQIQEATQPLRQQQAVATADYEAKSWFYNAANTVDPESGEPLFPDLFEESGKFDPNTAQAIVNAWGQLVRTHPHFGLTRDGIDYAVSIGRSQAQPAKAATARQVAAKVTRSANGQFLKHSEKTATDEASGGVDVVDATDQAQSMSEADKIRRDIRTAGKGDSKANFFGIA